MHGTNPYAQAGWYNPQNPHTINTQPWGSSAIAGPSIFGALPYPPSQSSLPTVLTFHYVCFNPDVLNCMITGPTSIPYLEVATGAQNGVPVTVFRKSDGRVLASVEWTRSPTVEVSGRLAKQPVGQWLRLSADRGHRAMILNGREVMWVQRQTNICAFSSGGKDALVNIHRGPQAITLELTTEAFHLGLLETSIIATVLLHSGRSLD
ncbi:hypothetical protein FA15DRAFT_89278 [Coprinopsis marcescibilis]|uniref:Uncharacterized protein n=1 Tax=Coprinopsis marcescibilis TaxID=230819 RepID=A0A5C3L5Y6_COPMA|nr:hypothetical protein FA15DRAFT_89278 [Coprinopsis marcescibilis]